MVDSEPLRIFSLSGAARPGPKSMPSVAELLAEISSVKGLFA